MKGIVSFSIKQLQEACGKEQRAIHRCVRILADKKIIISSPGEEIDKAPKGSFDLLAVPYCSNESSQILKDYVGNACIVKRHIT